MRWIEDDNPDGSVFWIYGPAGAGKSAIAQTLAELIQASGGSYGGSFFFSRGKVGREPTTYLQPLPTNSHSTTQASENISTR